MVPLGFLAIGDGPGYGFSPQVSYRTLNSAYLDMGKERCLKIGKSHKKKDMRISGQLDTVAGHAV